MAGLATPLNALVGRSLHGIFQVRQRLGRANPILEIARRSLANESAGGSSAVGEADQVAAAIAQHGRRFSWLNVWEAIHALTDPALSAREAQQIAWVIERAADAGKTGTDKGTLHALLQSTWAVRVGFDGDAAVDASLAHAERAGALLTDIRQLRMLADSVMAFGMQLAMQQRFDAAAMALGLVVDAPYLAEDDRAIAAGTLGPILYRRHQLVEAAMRLRQAERIVRQLAARDPQRCEPLLAETLLNLGAVLVSQGAWAETITALREAESLWRQHQGFNPPAYLPLLASTLETLGGVLFMQGDLQEATGLVEESLGLREGLASQGLRSPHVTFLNSVAVAAQSYAPLIASTLMNLGAIYDRQGFPDRAVGAWQKAATILRAQAAAGSPSALPLLITALNNTGAVLGRAVVPPSDRLDPAFAIPAASPVSATLARPETEQAIADLVEALAVADQLDADDAELYRADRAMIFLNLGNVYGAEHRWEQAASAYHAAAQLYQQLLVESPRHALLRTHLGGVLNNLAGVRWRQGRPGEAITLCEEALRLEQSPVHGTRWRILSSLGLIQPTADRAYDYFRAALVLREQRREGLAHTQDRHDSQRDHLQLYRIMVECCLDLGRHDESWWWAERAKSRSLLDLLRGTEPRLRTVADHALYKEWAEAEEAARSASKHREAQLRPTLTPTLGFADDAGGWEEQSALLAASGAAQERAARLYRRLRVQVDQGRDLTPMKIPSPARLTRLLRGLTSGGPHPAVAARPLLVEYFVLDPRRYVIYLVPLWTEGDDADRQGSAQATIIDVPEEGIDLDQLVAHFATLRDAVNRDLTAWAALPTLLGDVLLGPWAAQLARLQPTELILVPHDQLQLLPLHAGAQPNGEPLIARYPITYLPTAALARALVRRRKRAPRPEHRLILGPPVEDASLLAGNVEARRLARRWGRSATHYAGAAMTVDALRQHAGSIGVLHFATHAKFEPQDYTHSGIAFSQEVLSVAQLLSDPSLDLSGVRLCFLNSCSGARVQPDSGDDLPGLIWSLLYAGAEAVIASLWEVDDSAAATIAWRLYQHWEEDGMTLAAALQAAVRHLRVGKFSNPYYWAPFTLTGHGFS